MADFDINQPLPKWVLKYPRVIEAASRTSGGDGKQYVYEEFRKQVIKSGRWASSKKKTELNYEALRLLKGLQQ